MFYVGDFIEPARDGEAAPWRWRWGIGETARVRFGARVSCAASGVVRYSFAPVHGRWEVVEAREIDGAPSGHHLWETEIVPPDGEASCLYEIGYRDAVGGLHWSGVRRVLVFSDAPWRGTGPEQVEVGADEDGPVCGPRPARPMRPAPTNWRARMHYALLIDRFAIGRAARQGLGLVPYDPASPFAAHGGDLGGIHDRLDYLAELGAGAVILSPLVMNGPDGYHGYHPVDLYQLDPRLGTMEELRALVDAAHARDIAVILDVVVNHMAPMVDWGRDGAGWSGVFRYDLAEPGQVPLNPEGLRAPDAFHDPAEDGDPVRGRLFGFLEDWRTEEPHVRDALLLSLKHWLAESGADGFRYDAVRHVDPAFWRHATREIARYAHAIGKTGFVQIGEHSSPDEREAGSASRDGDFDGMIDYPLYIPMRDAMAGDRNAHRRVAEMLDQGCFAWTDSRRNLVFLENHDTSRALGLLGEERALLAWLALLFFGPGIPMIAQGQEQGFAGRLFDWTTPDGRVLVSDAYVREDVFPNPDCVWRGGSVNQPRYPPYDRTNEIFRTMSEMSRLRRALPGLHAGDRFPLRSAGDGVHVHFMGTGAERVMVSINLTAEPVALSLPVSVPLFLLGEVRDDGLGAYAAGLWPMPGDQVPRVS